MSSILEPGSRYLSSANEIILLLNVWIFTQSQCPFGFLVMMMEHSNDPCDCTSVGNSRRQRRRQPAIPPPYFLNGVILVLFLFSLEISSASGGDAPPGSGTLSRTLGKDKDGDKDGVEGPSSKTLFFGEDTNGVPIVVGTWFRYGSYTLAFAMFGQAFLISCIAASIYYVIFVVTEPSQQIRSNGGASSWNVGRVLRALQVAYDTYETFDPYSPACQLKTLCEIQESPYFQGTVLRRLTHYLVHTDLVETKLENAKELRAADKVGNDPGQQCQEKFEGCRFSLDKLYESYVTVMS